MNDVCVRLADTRRHSQTFLQTKCFPYRSYINKNTLALYLNMRVHLDCVNVDVILS